MSGYPVKVYIYDISKGLARQMSQVLIGKYLEGVWHTAIVVYGQEFFFGGDGISSCQPGHTILGQPEEIQDLGRTEVPSDVFFAHLHELGHTTFRPEKYHLLDHNCNTFSNEVAQFLTGKSIPSKITNLPQDVMSTPLGAMIRPFIDSMTVSPDAAGSQSFAPSAMSGASRATSSHAHANPPPPAAARPDCMVTFKEKDILEEFKKVKEELKTATDAQDFKILSEVHEFLSTAHCSWSLSKLHIQALARLVASSPSEVVQRVVGCLLSRCVLQPDILPVLTHNTDYLLLLAQFEQCAPPAQKVILRTMCNLCSTKAGCDWLLRSDGQPVGEFASNRKLTLSVCCSCLLNDDVKLNNIGSALCLNITRHKINSEVAMEMGIALIQLATKDLNKSIAQHVLLALAECLTIDRELAGVAQVMELDVRRFADMSPQHKGAVDKIHSLMSKAATS